MGLLRDEAQVNALFGLFGDSATVDARLVHGLRRTYRWLRNNIRGTPMELLGFMSHMESRFNLFLRQC
jgi:hypothetical protein